MDHMLMSNCKIFSRKHKSLYDFGLGKALLDIIPKHNP